MDIRDAAYHTVHDYPGGASALALRLGKSCTTLNHEVKPPAGSSAKLGLLDAVKIMEMSGDHRVMHAIAARLGQMVIPLPQLDADSPGANHLADVAREFAEVMQEVALGAADGRISDNERARIERSWGELLVAGQRMLAHFASLNAAGKPAAVALREAA